MFQITNYIVMLISIVLVYTELGLVKMLSVKAVCNTPYGMLARLHIPNAIVKATASVIKTVFFTVVDDFSVALLYHRRQNRLRTVERALDVGIDYEIERGFLGIDKAEYPRYLAMLQN